MKHVFHTGLYTVAALAALPCTAATTKLNIEVAAGEHDRHQTPVKVLVRLPAAVADAQTVTLKDRSGKTLIGQLTRPGLQSRRQGNVDERTRELHFILPSLAAGKKARFKATVSTNAPKAKAAQGRESFAWHDTPGKHTDLRFGSRPVLRYMYEKIDESSPAARELTYKPFHHLFNPTGTRLVTKGAGGGFTHHRGLYFGFNRISYGTHKNVDVWHCRGEAHQLHQEFLETAGGPVLGRHRVRIAWMGPGKQAFATEERELTVYSVPGRQLVEFASQVTSNVGKIRLDGDPQHAGFHFRADNEVHDVTKAQTYYLRPDGRGKPGETRNWPNQKDHVNLPWNAMSFVLGGQRYTMAYLDRPDNPKEARLSERDYGRFGSYFEYDLDTNRPLNVAYRCWLQEGELEVADVAAKSAAFVTPPVAVVK